ncbi:TetR/AcrR family transcriptional regulator [Ornithinimicrobium sp. Arc0846-15]|nr:TetR/AcrR family transcriptional regulator [Ornithinimicrobium laminariae]
MPPSQRRAHLEASALEVMRERGMAATTKEIAAQAGVAEGTIFRVFDCKEDLLNSALRDAFNPAPLIEALDQIDLNQPLRERLIQAVTLLQERVITLFDLMHAVGLVHPPEVHGEDAEAAHAQHLAVEASLESLIRQDAAELRIPAAELVQLVRLLTFSGSNSHITRGETLAPAFIVDTLLDGTRKATSC